jgi:hypothetical protein
VLTKFIVRDEIDCKIGCSRRAVVRRKSRFCRSIACNTASRAGLLFVGMHITKNSYSIHLRFHSLPRQMDAFQQSGQSIATHTLL